MVPQGHPEPLRWQDLAWLLLALAVLVASGLGLRDPWPADEPRFAVVARDMVASGDWLFPRVGGDLYQDKPPLYMWLIAAVLSVTGSMRVAFLLPSLLAAGGVLLLAYDLARRLAGRAAALAAALTLACTLQFVMVTRGAQIDATVCFLITLGVYGLARHLLLGPAWGWYFVGGVASGLGVITKGVGFLPLLILIPWAAMRRRGWQGLATIPPSGAHWVLAPLGFLAAIALWLVPMLLAVLHRGSPEYAAYRDEILFHQTVTRYAAAWHHVKAWYYYLVEVIPVLWLPWPVLAFWLVPRWRDAWRARDARVWLLLAWVVLVLLFFTMSPGKRGVYVLPALPALAVAAAGALPAVYARRGIALAGLVGAGVLALVFAAFALAEYLEVPGVIGMLAEEGLPGDLPVAAVAAACVGGWLVAAWWRPRLAWPFVLGALALSFSWAIEPRIDPVRSGSAFTRRVLAAVPRDHELGLVAYKEQFLLYLDRPTVNFGHRRWRTDDDEVADAARWLASAPNRVLLVPDTMLVPCFAGASVRPAGRSAGEAWSLVAGAPDTACVARGDARRAIRYPAPKYVASAPTQP
ncbi:MAG: Undecaprenyl phosphate-alpha-4-amino-4-deoxy-L-arabinose arabinosyl transferase [Steroidobacteraceae bacterium]|nr:Undecaprenyl phosphate-alpha-4-amino-4-deoxy-L-arabinose arabinosyl transferase [Steroidobacteraceae bacterium]